MMLTKIQKWGNSQGLRFSKTIMEEAHITVGDEVRISVADGKIVVEPTQKIRGKYTIEALVAQIPEAYVVEEVEWGKPEGNEVR
jgi:antitoxin MazE